MLAPRAARAGTIGVFAPSSPFPSDRFEAGVALLSRLGFGSHLHPQLASKRGFLAGTDDERVSALHDLLRDPRIDVVMAARGGYGALRFIDRIDADLVRTTRKPIVGFSDLTALHSAIQQRASVISIHGPVVTQLADLGEGDLDVLRRVLSGEWTGLEYAADGNAITGGCARGRLTGGCLSMIAHLVGSGLLYLPRGAILLIEEVGEAPYRVDRMLTHLRLAGVLNQVGGIALGDFIGCHAPREGEQTVDDVLRDRLHDLGVPVLTGLPFGHGRRNLAIPLGTIVTLDADRGRLVLEGEP